MKKILSLVISGILSLGLFCSNCYANPPREGFTPEEDQKLIELVREYDGPRDRMWATIANLMGNRNGNQCRQRYLYYLDPNINRSPFTPQEDELLLEKYNELGPKWSEISKFFNKRTNVALKCRYSLLQRHNKTIVQVPTVIPDIFDVSSDLDWNLGWDPFF